MNDQFDGMTEDGTQPEATPEEFSLENTDFNLEEDYKEDPLAPAGTYNGVVKDVKYNNRLNSIQWDIVAVNNEGCFLTDGETPVDGIDFEFHNWLPKPGDENIRSGRSNKRQNKINMLKTFQEDMEVDMNTREKIVNGIEEAEWVGLSVIMKVAVSTYQGKTRNQVNNLRRAAEEFELPDGIVPF